MTTVRASSKAQSTDYDWNKLFQQSYYNNFKKGFPPLKEYWDGLSNSNRVTDLQPLSYGLDAILAMYETTDSLSYLEDAIALTNNSIGKAQVTADIAGNMFRLKDSYKGWIEEGGDSTSGIYHSETVLSEIYFFQYVTRLLKDIHKVPSLYKIRKFRNFYDQTLDFVETNIWDKWVKRGIRYANNKDNYLFLSRTHMASHWAYIAAELSFLTNSTARKTAYLAFVDLYNTKLENNFYKYDRYISWNQTWDTPKDKESPKNDKDNNVQDVSHANLIVAYIVEAYDLGLWKDSDAVHRIINTLKDKLWDPKDCLFRDNINGTMFQSGQKGSVGSFQADGFVKLTRYDSSLFEIYEKFVSCSRFLTGWNQHGQLFANLALSKKLLKELE
ncbi:MAG: hypothetical protein ABI091_25295 [Ferruginibacter sp.]